jgi:hypothetical protein
VSFQAASIVFLTHGSISWLYRLYVAIDANFRLKRKLVSSAKADPGFSNGFSYFVSETPYKEFLGPRWKVPQEVRLTALVDVLADLC